MDHPVVKNQKVIAVCGVKNSGKTTLLARIVSALTKKGFHIAVIKSDGHDFTCDMPGTDSYRLKQAGAYGTAVYSPSRIFVHKTGRNAGAKELITEFPEADMIFIEGAKESTYPKIEVIREGISDSPVSNPAGRFLIVTDINAKAFHEPTACFEDLDEILRKIEKQ